MSTRIPTGEMSHRCQFCDKLFAFPCELNDHVKSHTGDKPYKGMLSEDSFVYVKYKWNSPKRARVKCQLTENSFAYKEYHWNHKKTGSGRQTGKKPFENECEKYLAQISKLKGCIRTSNDEKPYKCQFCEKSFVQNRSLKKHLLTHTGETPYKCKFCEKSFAKHGNLQSHVLTHTGEKTYKCHSCQKSFMQKRYLKRHMITYMRELCNKTSNLHRGIRTNEKTYICKEPAAESSASTKQLQFDSRVNPLELKLEKVVIANVSNEGVSFSTSKTTDEGNETPLKNVSHASNEVTDELKLIGTGECLSINRLELSEDARLFYEKSYGCGICDEILEMKEAFLEHCSGHGLTSFDELLDFIR